MKAVLLAGGLGTRMREETEFRPKPMVEVGGRPVLWHIMKMLGQQGLEDFVVATGYKSEIIKNYFSNYGSVNQDFTRASSASLHAGATKLLLPVQRGALCRRQSGCRRR